jgi:general secretion pathway protein D
MVKIKLGKGVLPMHSLQRYALIGLLVLLLAGTGFIETVNGQDPQERREIREFTPPDAIVSMERQLGFDRAIAELNEISKQYTGKILIDPQRRNGEIGVHIEAMHWRDALERILRHNNLWYDEREDHFLIMSHPDVAERDPERPFDPDRPTLRSREVNISAVFFEVSHSKMRESGVRWNFLRTDDNFGEISAGVGTGRLPNPVGQIREEGIVSREDRSGEIGIAPTWSFADLNLLMRLFEETDIGEVIASPEVTVRSGQTGRIQVGEDISIKQRDFAGNIIDRFISTGTIIDVTPEVIVEDGIPFIALEIAAERSTGTPGVISTVIAKAEAETRVILLDGEETVIGGLYVTEERVLREGVPLLKDLPWWFFGLKYLFGYNRIERDKQELIILLRANLVPTLEERIAAKRDRHLLQERRQHYQEDMDRLREAGELRKE